MTSILSQDNALQAEADNIDGYSANIGLSDLENDQTSESQNSDSSHDENGDSPAISEVSIGF